MQLSKTVLSIVTACSCILLTNIVSPSTSQIAEDKTEETWKALANFVKKPETTETLARAFFWISPYFNMNIFFYVLSFALMPIVAVWLFIIYPPGKFYSNIPPIPQYVGYSTSNYTPYDTYFVDLLPPSD